MRDEQLRVRPRLLIPPFHGSMDFGLTRMRRTSLRPDPEASPRTEVLPSMECILTLYSLRRPYEYLPPAIGH